MASNSPIVNWITQDQESMDWSDRSILDFVDFVAEGDLNIIPTSQGEHVEETEENSDENDERTTEIIQENNIITQVNRLDRVFHDISNTSHKTPLERQDDIPRIIWNPDQWWINFIRANNHNS
jgi:hypothetical protein